MTRSPRLPFWFSLLGLLHFSWTNQIAELADDVVSGPSLGEDQDMGVSAGHELYQIIKEGFLL